MKFAIAPFWRRMLLFSLLTVWCSLASEGADFTAVDNQGVIYDIIDGTDNVIVSQLNRQKFSNTVVDIEIPESFLDVSETSTGKTFRVVGMADYAFNYTQVRNVDIKAPITEVPNSAFAGCRSLVTVKLPSTVTTIKNSAFNGSYLQTIELPESVTKIEHYAFTYCSKLTYLSAPGIEELGTEVFKESGLITIDLGNKLKKIPASTFYNCYYLKDVALPNSLEEIGNYAFSNCSALTISNQWPTSLKKIGERAFYYCTSFGTVVIAPWIEYGNQTFYNAGFTTIDWGDTEAKLPKGMFQNAKIYQEFVAPSWMKTIPEDFFSGAELLRVTIPGTVEDVVPTAFGKCQKLESLTLEEGIKDIRYSAFQSTTALKSVNIPKGVVLGNRVFDNSGLTEVIFPEEPFSFQQDFLGRLNYIEKMTVPGYITKLPSNSFDSWNSITEITLEEGVEQIGLYAISNLSKLSTLNLPNSLKTIRAYGINKLPLFESLSIPATDTIFSYAINNCANLKELRFSSAYLSKTVYNNCSKVRKLSFYGKDVRVDPDAIPQNSITDLIFEPGVETISDYAFWNIIRENSYNPTWVFNLQFPEGLKKIGKYSFAHFYSYVQFPKLPESLEEIGDYAFFRTATSIVYGERRYEYVTQKLPNIKRIGEKAFSYVLQLTGVELPDHYVEVGDFAFERCRFNTFDVPEWMEVVPRGLLFENSSLQRNIGFHDHIKEIGDSAFVRCFPLDEMTELIIPQYPVKYGKYVFAENFNFKKVVLPDNMTVLPEGMFYGCEDLEDINLDNIEVFEPWSMAMTDTYTHMDFHLSPNVKKIGERAFHFKYVWGAAPEQYEPVTIREDVELDDYALAGSRFSKIIFEGCREIPKGCLADTRLTEGVVLPTCMTEIPDSMMTDAQIFGNPNMFLNDKITRIGKYAFARCLINTYEKSEDGFYHVTIPESVTEIGESAFYNDTTTTIGNFPGGIIFHWPSKQPKMGGSIFRDNKLIHQFEVPANWDSIPYRTFYYGNNSKNGYTGLTSLTFEARTGENADRVLDIQREAFKYAIGGISTLDFNHIKFKTQYQSFAKSKMSTVINYENITELGDSTFVDNYLTEFKIPPFIKRIPDGCFAASQVMTTFAMDEGLEEIGKAAFQSSLYITELDIPSTVRVIDDNAFKICRGLNKITFNGPLDYIGSGVFFDCRALTELVFPYRVNKIGNRMMEFEHSVYYPSKSTLTKIEFTSGPDTIPQYMLINTIQLTDVKFAPDTREMETGSFFYCPKLKTITLPDSLRTLHANVFQNCTIEHLDLGNGLNRVDAGAMQNVGLKSLRWCPALKTVGTSAFAGTSITELELPDGFAPLKYRQYQEDGITKNEGMMNYVFQMCNKLTKIKIGNVGEYALSPYMFQSCAELTDVELGSVEEIPNYCFDGCSKLANISFDKVSKIGSNAFSNCIALPALTFSTPTITIMSNAFFRCSGITALDFKSAESYLADRSFYSNDKLKTVNFDGLASVTGAFRECMALENVSVNGNLSANSYAFYYCNNLKDISLPTDSSLVAVGKYAFDHCENLSTDFTRHIPYIKSGIENSENIFSDCRKFEQVTMPKHKTFTTAQYKGSRPGSIFKNCISLQSFTYPHTEPCLTFMYYDIQEAPLEAISYIYAKDIEYYPQRRLGQFANGTVNYTGTKSKLMVQRGQKWKFIEQGFGARFDIEEMKDPRIELKGDIHSVYDPASNRNKYLAYLRWELPLSDLNADGDTHARIFRGDRKIVELTFKQPTEPYVDEKYDGKRVVRVDVELDGDITDCTFSGDMELPFVDTDGSTTYRLFQGAQTNSLIFDADSEKRLDGFDQFEYTSWFLLKDEFYSPEIGKGDYPTEFTYSAEIDSYEYKTIENNENLEKDTTTGLRYHETDWLTTSTLATEPVTLKVIDVRPTLNGPGYLTLDDVKNDKGKSLNATQIFTNGEAYSIGWCMDDDLAAASGIAYGSTPYNVAEDIQLVEIQSDGSGQYIGDPIKVDGHAHGDIPTIDIPQINPNSRYVLVTHSPSRGYFGSRMLSIPTLPELTASVKTRVAPHYGEEAHTSGVPIEATVTITPDATKAGYDTAMPANCFHIGAWRDRTEFDVDAPDYSDDENDEIETIEDIPMQASWRDDAAEQNLQLIHHVDGMENCSSNCGSCSATQSAVTSDEGLTITHVYDVAGTKNVVSSYSGRLYLKLPSSAVPGDERWVAVDAAASTTLPILSGVEDVTVDSDMLEADGEETWYDLQGVRVVNPVSGQLYIRVTPQGNSVVKY